MLSLGKSNARIRFNSATYFDLQFNSLIGDTSDYCNNFAIVNIASIIWLEISLDILIINPKGFRF